LKALSCLVLSYPVLPNTRQNTHKPFETLYSRLLIAVNDIIIFKLIHGSAVRSPFYSSFNP
jgi:hypothetical protein